MSPVCIGVGDNKARTGVELSWSFVVVGAPDVMVVETGSVEQEPSRVS